MATAQTTEAFLQAQLARPLTHRVTTVYEGGAVKTHDTRSLAQAKTYADFVARPRIGRTLIDRETGATVRVIAVTVDAL